MEKRRNIEKKILDSYTVQDLIEEILMERDREGRDERIRAFEIRDEVLAFLDKKNYSSCIEALFDNVWRYSANVPDGLDIPAKDWPIARRLIKRLKSIELAKYWLAKGEAHLTNPTFKIIRSQINGQKDPNADPGLKTGILKVHFQTENCDSGLDLKTSPSQMNVPKEYQQKHCNVDHGLKTDILTVHSQTENYDTESDDMGSLLEDMPPYRPPGFRDIKFGGDFTKSTKTDSLLAHSQTENCDAAWGDLGSLLEEIPPYRPPGSRYLKCYGDFTKSTKILSSKKTAKGPPKSRVCDDKRALKSYDKSPARKASAERRRELKELDSLLKETEHLNRAPHTTHSDDTVEKRVRKDTPWSDELITVHNSGQIPTTKPFKELDRRELSRRPNVPINGRSKRGSKRYQKGHRPLPAGPDPQERCNNPDKITAEVCRGDISNRTRDHHKLGGNHGCKDKEVEYVKETTEASEIDSCHRKRRETKKKGRRGSKRERIVSDEKQPHAEVKDVGKHHNVLCTIPICCLGTKLQVRLRGRRTPVAESCENPMLFSEPEPVGNTQPHSTLSRSLPSLKRRIIHSVRIRLDRFKTKIKALCCCS